MKSTFIGNSQQQSTEEDVNLDEFEDEIEPLDH